MLRVGLSGNIGCGKTVVARIFEALSVPVYHSDDEAKIILNHASTKKELENFFGKEIFDDAGKTDRKKLAEIVFNNKEKLSTLNNIIHPALIKNFEEWVAAQNDASYVIMESAILFETGYAKIFHWNIVVTAPENIRIERVLQRDQVSKDDIIKRMQNQLPEDEKAAKADFLIINDNHQLLIPQVLKLHQKFNEERLIK